MSTKAELVEAARRQQLMQHVPEVFGPGTMLYVGASPRRAQFLGELMAAGQETTLLEIWPENCRYFEGRGLQVVCGDVRQVTAMRLPLAVYDLAFWWHGPEHVPAADLAGALAGLEARARLVVVGSPWGESRQAEVDGNVHQRHVASLAPEAFERLGYRVDTIGRVNGGSRSNILAVKWTS